MPTRTRKVQMRCDTVSQDDYLKPLDWSWEQEARSFDKHTYYCAMIIKTLTEL